MSDTGLRFGLEAKRGLEGLGFMVYLEDQGT